MSKIYCFTDGSCLNNGKINAISSYSFIIYEEDENFFCELCDCASKVPNQIKQSNNIGELMAIKETLKFLLKEKKNNHDILLYTDSMYCINSVSDDGAKWYIKWERTNWTKPILNKEIIQEIISLRKMFSNIKFVYIKAHTNLHKTSTDSFERFLYENNNYVDNRAKSQLK